MKFVFLLLISVGVVNEAPLPKVKDTKDTRVKKIEKYFAHYHAPAAGYAHLMVSLSDKHHLDWRLLPAIAMVESTGGKFYIPATHNFIGWGNGEIYFSSVEACISHAAERLDTGVYYKGKSLRAKMKSWNQADIYYVYITNVMKQLDSIDINNTRRT